MLDSPVFKRRPPLTNGAISSHVRRVLVTGIWGNLGRRLAPLLEDFEVVSVDYRPHIYAGATVDNFILRAFRGKASGRGWLARIFENHGWRLPTLVPASAHGENLFQFVHVDDVASVLLWTLQHFRPGFLGIFDLAGSGPPISFAECGQLAGTPIIRLPSERWVRTLLRMFWAVGLSGVPRESLPYFLGSYTMDTTRLQQELGAEYLNIVRYSSREALREALRPRIETQGFQQKC